MKKRTIKTKEVKKKKNYSKYISTFLSTPLKCDRSKRSKLRITKYIAARAGEYSGLNNQLFHERGDTKKKSKNRKPRRNPLIQGLPWYENNNVR